LSSQPYYPLSAYRNWSTHGETYLAKCKELNFTPVLAALPEQQDGSGDLNEESTQQNLDGFVKSVPKWSKEGLLQHIVDFVVSDDQVGLQYLYFVF
jgi:hypothetical protein